MSEQEGREVGPPGTWKVVLNDADQKVVAGAGGEATAAQLAAGHFARAGAALLILDDTGAAVGGIGIADQPQAITEPLSIVANRDPENGMKFSFEATGVSGTAFWDFGDGLTEQTAEPVVEHTYASDGNYRVTLTASGQTVETYVDAS